MVIVLQNAKEARNVIAALHELSIIGCGIELSIILMHMLFVNTWVEEILLHAFPD